MGRKRLIGYMLIPRGESKKSCKESISELRRRGCRRVICEEKMSFEETEEIHMSYDGTIFDINKYEDKYVMRQKALLELINNLGENTVLMVDKLDSLTTSTSGVITVLRRLGERKAGFRSIKESINTTRLNDETIPNLFKVLSKFKKKKTDTDEDESEEKKVAKRVRGRLRRAHARGHKIGRPTIETTKPKEIKRLKELVERYKKLKNKKSTIRRACLEVGICPQTWYNYLKRENLDKKTTKT